MARAFAVGLEAAGGFGIFQRAFHAEQDGFRCEEPLLHAHRFGERVQPGLRRRAHDAQQRAPIHEARPREKRRAPIDQPHAVFRHQHVADFINAPPPCAAEHLQNLIRANRNLDAIAPIRGRRQRDAAQREVNPRRQPHRGDHHAQLPRLGQRLDDSRARAIAQAAVVIRHSAAQHPRDLFADECLLLGRERERILVRKEARQLHRQRLGLLAARGENQHRPQILRQRLCHETRPVALHLAGHGDVQALDLDFLQRDGAGEMPDELHLAPEPLEPFHDVVRVLHAATQEQQSRLRRSHRDAKLVVQPTVAVREHLILVNHQQRWAIASDEPVFLRLESGDEHGRVEVVAQVTRRDAHMPAARAPLREFVVRQRASRDGVDGLPRRFAIVRPQLEDERFARARRGVDDDVFARAQRSDGLLLPCVWDRGLGEGELFGRWFRFG